MDKHTGNRLGLLFTKLYKELSNSVKTVWFCWYDLLAGDSHKNRVFIAFVYLFAFRKYKNPKIVYFCLKFLMYENLLFLEELLPKGGDGVRKRVPNFF